jgi:hypothetical protein
MCREAMAFGDVSRPGVPVLALDGGRGDGSAGTEAVRAESLVVLQLEQPRQPGFLAEGGRHPQLTARVGQHHPGQPRLGTGEPTHRSPFCRLRRSPM